MLLYSKIISLIILCNVYSKLVATRFVSIWTYSIVFLGTRVIGLKLYVLHCVVTRDANGKHWKFLIYTHSSKKRNTYLILRFACSLSTWVKWTYIFWLQAFICFTSYECSYSKMCKYIIVCEESTIFHFNSSRKSSFWPLLRRKKFEFCMKRRCSFCVSP